MRGPRALHILLSAHCIQRDSAMYVRTYKMKSAFETCCLEEEYLDN